ncbi:MAG: response regulator, partial [Hyphomicrobium sp.]
ETAHRNSLRLLKLVNSLLDFSRIEAGRADVTYEPTDLAVFTSELASNFESATERAGLSYSIECEPLKEPVYVDRNMWEKIVLNLVSNAFKFTLEGGIAVHVRQSDDGAFAELVVRDTGGGIPPAELPRLFERFHRIEGQKSRSYEGSGIGLALVQELVKLHGGSISAESEVDLGTSFTVSIPFGTQHLAPDRIGGDRLLASTSLRAEAYIEEALRWLPEAASEGSMVERAEVLSGVTNQDRTSGETLLVADDNADMRSYLQRILGSRWNVAAVGNGRVALEAIRTNKPDLVITDVMMPELDGFGLLRYLRDDPALRDIPVIMLSARAGEEAQVEGLQAGADDYLTKPFSARELLARVTANLDMARFRREASREIVESESRFRNMAEHAPVMMWMTDQAGSVTYLNPAWLQFTGQNLEEALGHGAWDCLHSEDRDTTWKAFFEANAAHIPFRTEFRLRRKDGAYRWALSAAAPRFADTDVFVGYIGSVIDISDRKEAEQILKQDNAVLEQRVNTALAERATAEAQLRQAQKMESIGKLTGGVAHDFNNVLQIIGGNLQLLVRDTAGNLRAEQRLQTAIAAVARGSKLASQLLAFGRRHPLAPKVINLGRLIRGIDDLLRRALGESIEIETVIAGGLWNTHVDATQVENALLNLAINARDAMNAHGRLTIEAGNASLDDDYASQHSEVQAGQYVMVAVTDTGCGMTPDVIDQVFEPFFTTKPEGQGTGLGLSMVYGFVKQSGGHIKIYSEVGQGTTVRMYLPRVRENEDIETITDPGIASGGTETILVVEDDDDVRSTVVDMLSDLGYRVLKARDAMSGLAIVESGVEIDLLFSDVVMPGPLRSPELARKAQERQPNLAVLFTSGYTENAIVHGGRIDEGVELLSKPYTREALARKIRLVLTNHHQRRRTKAGESPYARIQTVPQNESREAGRLRILFVEDEALIRLSISDILSGLGHEVTEAANGDEALAALQQEEFDVLITDLSLPGMHGTALAHEAKKRQPKLQIIFATGAVSSEIEGVGNPIVLRKPYTEDDIIIALKKAVSSA